MGKGKELWDIKNVETQEFASLRGVGRTGLEPVTSAV